MRYIRERDMDQQLKARLMQVRKELAAKREKAQAMRRETRTCAATRAHTLASIKDLN